MFFNSGENIRFIVDSLFLRAGGIDVPFKLNQVDTQVMFTIVTNNSDCGKLAHLFLSFTILVA